MRLIAAAGVLALLAAAPAAALNGGNGVSSALHAGPLVLQGKTVQDRSRTCQASDKKAQHSTVIGNTHRPAVVACEQPPKSSPITADQIAKATAAALAILG